MNDVSKEGKIEGEVERNYELWGTKVGFSFSIYFRPLLFTPLLSTPADHFTPTLMTLNDWNFLYFKPKFWTDVVFSKEAMMSSKGDTIRAAGWVILASLKKDFPPFALKCSGKNVLMIERGIKQFRILNFVV